MRILACVAGLLLAGAGHHAPAAEWRMDPLDSRLEFVATFEKTAAPGIFREFDTRMRFDPDKPVAGQIDVTIKLASADMKSTAVNKAIGGPDWFDLARYPQAEFHATDIRRADSIRYLARGVLSLKGIDQPIEVPFAWSVSTGAAMLEGEVTIKRGLFRIGIGEWASTNVVGAEVKVKFRVRLRKVG